MLLQQVSRWWPGSGTPPETARAESRRASARRLPPISAKVHFSASRPSFDFFIYFFSAVSSISRKWTTTQSIVAAIMPWLDQEVAWLIKIIATYGYGYESEVSLSYLPIRIPSTAKPEPRTVGEHDRKYAQLFVDHGNNINNNRQCSYLCFSFRGNNITSGTHSCSPQYTNYKQQHIGRDHACAYKQVSKRRQPRGGITLAPGRT